MAPQIRPLSTLPRFGGTTRQRSNFKRRYLAPLLLIIPLIYYFTRPTRSSIPFHYPLGDPKGNLTFSPTPSRQIPPYLHYVFGLSEDFGGYPFAFIQYICLSSALEVIKPEIIYFHYVHSPTGWWWDQYKKRVESKGGKTRLEMVKQRDVVSIHGNEVTHFAHKADVLRLEALRDYGGVYLDTDVLVIRDFGSLYQRSMVMGMESQPNLEPSLPPSGLCNAVILSKPYSSFVMRWLESYRTFDKSKWATHSVNKPWSLAQQFPYEITVLNKYAFFWPLWHDDHLRLIHRSSSYSFHSPQSPTSSHSQFTYHLWESLSYPRYLSDYDPDRIHQKGMKKGKEREEDGKGDESAFSREGRKWVGEELRRDWRKAKKEGLIE